MNLTLPEWCTNEVYQKMQEIILLEYDIRSYTTQLKRLNGGFLVKRFIDNMNPRGDPNNKPSRKIYIYSGHEINIAAFAKVHNMSKPRLPDYGSAFIVEKLRDENDNVYIKVINTQLSYSSYRLIRLNRVKLHTQRKNLIISTWGFLARNPQRMS